MQGFSLMFSYIDHARKPSEGTQPVRSPYALSEPTKIRENLDVLAISSNQQGQSFLLLLFAYTV